MRVKFGQDSEKRDGGVLVKYVSTGESHAACIDCEGPVFLSSEERGNVYVWGSGSQGQLGSFSEVA